MTYTLKSNEEIIRTIRGCTDLETLLNLAGGVIVGKNQRRYIVNSEEHHLYTQEVLEILMALSVRVVELAPVEWRDKHGERWATRNPDE